MFLFIFRYEAKEKGFSPGTVNNFIYKDRWRDTFIKRQKDN